MIIESGSGNGKIATVDSDNRLSVVAFNLPFQHLVAKDYNKTFQVWGEANLASGTVTPIHVKNNTSDKVLVLTYLRWQVIDPTGGTGLPSAANYMSFGYGPTYSSGGTATSPINMSSGSSVVSGAVAYEGNPTLSGSLTEADRWYPAAEGEMYYYNKEGAAIILPGATFAMQFTGDHTSGKVMARVSYAEVALDGYSG